MTQKISFASKVYSVNLTKSVVNLIFCAVVLSIFSDKNSLKHLFGLQLWHLFKYAKLTEAARRNDKLLIHLLNKVRVGNTDDDNVDDSYSRKG